MTSCATRRRRRAVSCQHEVRGGRSGRGRGVRGRTRRARPATSARAPPIHRTRRTSSGCDDAAAASRSSSTEKRVPGEDLSFIDRVNGRHRLRYDGLWRAPSSCVRVAHVSLCGVVRRRAARWSARGPERTRVFVINLGLEWWGEVLYRRGTNHKPRVPVREHAPRVSFGRSGEKSHARLGGVARVAATLPRAICDRSRSISLGGLCANQ